MTLFYLGLAWLFGAASASLLAPPVPMLIILAVPGVGTLLMWLRERVPRLVALCWLVLLAGCVRTVLATAPPSDPDYLAAYGDTGENVTVIGTVDREPDVRDTFQLLRIRAESIMLGDETTVRAKEVHGWLLARVARYPVHRYGERLSVTGRLATPRVFPDFDYRDYLARQGIYVVMYYPRVRILAQDQGSPFWQALYEFRQHVSAVITHILPEPHAALLSAILLGERSGIPASLYAQFNATGTSHVIVISGSNIAILCGVLLAVVTRLAGRRIALYVSLIGIAAYVLLAGADAPVIRAAIMGGLYVLALRFGRRSEVRTSLVLAAVLMTMVNPAWIRDPGFQLSFSATAGLIWLTPLLENVLASWIGRLQGVAALASGLLGDGLVVTLAAQIATLPVTAYHFARISPVSLLTNVLIVPVQPLIMLSGALATLSGLIWLPVGQVLGWLSWLPLTWMIRCVESTAHIADMSGTGNLDTFGRVGVTLGTVLFVAILYLALYNRRRIMFANAPGTLTRLRPSTRLSLALAGIGILLASSAHFSLPDGRLHVTFLDVGQGDAILITTPRGSRILVDGGRAPSAVLAALGQRMPFWERTLDWVINTHPEADHLGGLIAVLERYRVKQVLMPPVEARSTLYTAWHSTLQRLGIRPIMGQSGMRIGTSDGVSIEVLHPAGSPNDTRANDYSLVLRITLGSISFLLTGDITPEVERALLDQHLALRATVLKVPHHGSAISSSPAFLQAVQPRIVVLSVAANNELNLPAHRALQRYQQMGIPVMRTDQNGTIEFITDGEQLWASVEYTFLSSMADGTIAHTLWPR
ncbi:MAG: DNA internalization-related competence protein ComEC/Rec2 [Anaerolineae bacterium]